MPNVMQSLMSFGGGELSPKLDARIDNPKYRHALRQCLNMVPLRQGPLTRRPGTQYIAAAKLQTIVGINPAVRLMPFTFSPSTTFMLEFGHFYVRFYSNGAQVHVNSAPLWVSGNNYVVGNFVTSTVNGLIYYCIAAINNDLVDPANDGAVHWAQQTIYEIPSPYSANAWGLPNIWATDVWTIVPCQINDVVYLVHPNYPPYKLTRIADTNWTLAQVAFNKPALLDQNVTDTTIAASATTGSVTLTATAPAWVTTTYYAVGNSVLQGGVIYNCIVAHVSGTFATDLAAGKWSAVTLFNSGHIGSTWQLGYLRNSAYLELTGTAANGFSTGIDSTGPVWAALPYTSGTITVLGGWEVHTYGVWVADIAIQRSVDGGRTWDTVVVVTGRSDRNVDIAGTASVMAQYRFVLSVPGALSPVPINPGATPPRVVFECVNAFLYGTVEITAVASATSATATVIDQLWSTSGTEYWSEAAWSAYRGYPQAVTSFQQRIIYGSSGYEPQRIWGTVTNDIENFDRGDASKATDSFAFDLNAPARGPIVWLLGQLSLFVGFSGAEWVVTSGSSTGTGASTGAAITPSNVQAIEQSSWGSIYGVAPMIVGDALMFCQRQGISTRQMLFNIYQSKYTSDDVTVLADHLFTPGIVQMAYQQRFRNQAMIWAVTKQGLLLSMTYDMNQEVVGWAKHRTGDAVTAISTLADNGFESVVVIDGQGQADDEVWVVVNRFIGTGNTMKRYIERLNPNNWETEFTGAPNPPAPVLADAFYVDSGTTILNPGSATLTGLDHLANRYVVGLADGVAFGPILVVANSVTIPAPATVATVQIGLAMPYVGQPMRLDFDGNNVAQGKTKQMRSRLFLRVMNSCGGQVWNGVATSPPVPIPFTSITNPLVLPALVTGPKDIALDPMMTPVTDDNAQNDPIIIVQGSDAYPLTVLALIPRYSIDGTP